MNVGFWRTGGYLTVLTPKVLRVETAAEFDVATETARALPDTTVRRDANKEDFILDYFWLEGIVWTEASGHRFILL